MKTDNTSGLLLTGTLLLAGVDMSGLLDYGLKAFLGGAIWMAFKMAGEYIDRRKRKAAHDERR